MGLVLGFGLMAALGGGAAAPGGAWMAWSIIDGFIL